jgi:hypothetical protein
VEGVVVFPGGSHASGKQKSDSAANLQSDQKIRHRTGLIVTGVKYDHKPSNGS